MPNLGPGVANSLTPAVTPTWVFTPTPNVTATVRITNNGSSTIYIGGANVSQWNGIPLPPGNRPIELQNCPYTIYTAAGAFPAGTNTTLSGSQVQGVSALTVASGSGGVIAGATLQVGNGTNLEYVVVNTIANAGGTAGSSTITTTTPFLYDHVASSTVSTATPRTSGITVQAGVV
jgi:hypothetical protein